MRFVVVGVCCVVVACDPAGPAPFRGSCSVVREQAEEVTSRVEYALDVDAGGPLVCIPGEGSCDPCVGDVVTLPQGAQTTLAVSVLNRTSLPFNIVDVTLPHDADPSFAVLAPVPAEVAPGTRREVFVGVIPTSTAEIEADVLVTSDATNQAGEPFAVTLRVAGAP